MGGVVATTIIDTWGRKFLIKCHDNLIWHKTRHRNKLKWSNKQEAKDSKGTTKLTHLILISWKIIQGVNKSTQKSKDKESSKKT
jgi:hypothetical protein